MTSGWWRAHFGADDPDVTNVLGVGVSAVNLDTAVERIERCIAEGRREYVCVRDVHGIVACQRSERLRAIHNSAMMVTPDGVPLVWISRWAGHAEVGRVYGPDLMLRTLERSTERGWRHYLYGGTPGVVEELAIAIRARFPRASIAGAWTPPFRDADAFENEDVLQAIDRSCAQILWVGLGTPKQEIWMANHRGRLNVPVLIGVGAAFDFLSGRKRQAPTWMQRSSLEWVFRLASEPRRLAGRYLMGHPQFVLGVLGQLLGLRRYRGCREGSDAQPWSGRGRHVD